MPANSYSVSLRFAPGPLRLAAFILALASICCGAVSPPADIDTWVNRAMTVFEVPGIAIAIVKDGTPVLLKGYGVRKLGEPGKVDEHTLFGVASNTKAFTATAMGILVNEGKASWDDSVQKFLPSFQVYDPWVSRELTIRDLLSHRTGLGLGAGDLLFWPDTDMTREQVIAAARYIRPASSLRSRYAYNNLAFVVAGEVIRSITGKPWEDAIRSRLLLPAGMNETRITSVGFQPADNVASPHSRGWRLEGTLTPIPMTRDETWAAAAGIKSSVADMAKWISVHLNSGRAGDRTLWSEAVEKDLTTPQTIVPIGNADAALRPLTPKFSAYGLGFLLRDYRGRKIVSHTGGLAGMVTTVVMVPEEKLGIVVLTNQEEGGAMSAIAYHVLDHYFDAPESDWITAFRTARLNALKKANDAEKKLENERASSSTPSLSLTRYAGDYSDPWYGNISVALENDHLILRMSHTPSMVADLRHWQYDTFRAVFRDKTVPDAFVTFTLNFRGNIEEMKLVPVSSLADFSFDYQDLSVRPVEKRAR